MKARNGVLTPILRAGAGVDIASLDQGHYSLLGHRRTCYHLQVSPQRRKAPDKRISMGKTAW